MKYFLSTSLEPTDPERVTAEQYFPIARPDSIGTFLLRYPGYQIASVPVSATQARLPNAEDTFRFSRWSRDHTAGVSSGTYITFYIIRQAYVAWVYTENGNVVVTSAEPAFDDTFDLKARIKELHQFIDTTRSDYSFWSATLVFGNPTPVLGFGCTMSIDMLVQEQVYKALHTKIYNSCCRSVF